MPRVYLTSRGRPGVGFGCLGSVLIGLLYVMATLVFVGVVVLILGVFVAAMVVAAAAVGINRLLMAISPKFRSRRHEGVPFQPTSKVIETTAKVISSTKPKRRS